MSTNEVMRNVQFLRSGKHLTDILVLEECTGFISIELGSTSCVGPVDLLDLKL